MKRTYLSLLAFGAPLLALGACGNKDTKEAADAGKAASSSSASASSVVALSSATPDAAVAATKESACAPEKGGKYALRFPADDKKTFTAMAADSCGNVVLAGSFKKSIELGGPPLESKDKEDIFIAKFGTKGNHIFSRAIAGMGKQGVRGVGVDAKSNIYFTGVLEGAITLGTTVREPHARAGSNFLVARLSPEGEATQFSRVLYDDAHGASPIAMTVDGDGNMFLAGKFARALHLADGSPPYSSPTGGIFIAKYNAYAAHRNSFTIAADKYPNAITVSSIATDKEGNVVIAGSFENEADFGKGKVKSAGKTDMFLAKYAPIAPSTFELSWVKRMGDGETNSGESVAVDSEGNVIFAGVDDRKSPGEPAWKRQRVVELWKYDGAGKKIWGPKYFGMGTKEGVDDPVVRASGTNFALVGTINENMNVGAQSIEVPKGSKLMFLSTFNDSGKALASEYSELELPSPRQVIYDANQEIVVTGNTATKPLPGGSPYGIFLQKFSPAP